MNKVYFWFSLTFLITRTVAVSLFASYIHDESKKSIYVLRAIPRYSWCKEAFRFSEEVVNETVALSGLKFFFLTRRLILTVRIHFGSMFIVHSMLIYALFCRLQEQLSRNCFCISSIHLNDSLLYDFVLIAFQV